MLFISDRCITVYIYIVNCGSDINAGEPVTNSEGYFAVGALPEGQYQVFPEEEGYIFHATNWHWVYLAQEPGQPFDFTSQTD